MRPIPKSALYDTALVRVPIMDADSYDGVAGYERPVVIQNVRWEARANLKPAQHIFSDGSVGLLYVDRINSAGAFEIPVGSIVTVRDQGMTAVQTFPAYGLNGVVHHWEVELR